MIMSEDKEPRPIISKAYLIGGLALVMIAIGVWVVPELMKDAEIFSDEKFFQTAYLTDNCFAEISKNSTGTYLQGIVCNGDVDKREFSMAYNMAIIAVAEIEQGNIVESDSQGVRYVNPDEIDFGDLDG
jgi:hypothetical protein